MGSQKYKPAQNWSCTGKYWKKAFNGFDVWERRTTQTLKGEQLDTVTDFVITRQDMILSKAFKTKNETHTIIENFVTLDEALIRADLLEVKDA